MAVFGKTTTKETVSRFERLQSRSSPVVFVRTPGSEHHAFYTVNARLTKFRHGGLVVSSENDCTNCKVMLQSSLLRPSDALLSPPQKSTT